MDSSNIYGDHEEKPRIVATDDYRFIRAREVPPVRPLPNPTRDLADLKADLDVHGYCMVADALTADDVLAIRDRFNEQFEAERRLGSGIVSPNAAHQVCNLLAKGEIFQKAIMTPFEDEVLEHLLGEDFLLSAMCAIQTTPGSKAQGLHFDQFHFGIPTVMPLVANAFFMIEEFTEENGGTRLVPGSHLWGEDQINEYFEGLNVAKFDGENPAGTIAAEGPAGTCLIFEGRILHGSGKNATQDRTRTAISSYYCRPWLRPFENAFLSIPDDIMSSFSSSLRGRLGYKAWGLAGGYEAPGTPPSLDAVRPNDQIRELRL